MEFLLIHDLAVLVSRENTKFVEPIPAGVKDFQFAVAEAHPNGVDSHLSHSKLRTWARFLDDLPSSPAGIRWGRVYTSVVAVVV
jgi:hypothetical protein